jgi:hypothetical protein
VGESHRKKIIRIRNFNCLAPMSPLSACPTATVKSERGLRSSQVLLDFLPAQEALYCDGNELP